MATRDLDAVARIDGYLTALVVNSGGDRLLLSLSQLPGGEAQKVALWDANAFVELCSVAGENGAFTFSRAEAFAATRLDLVTLFGSAACGTIQAFSAAGSIGRIALAPDADTLALTGSSGGRLWFYDFATGALLDDVALQDDRPIDRLAFSPDGKLLLALGPGRVSVWEVGLGN